MTQDRFADMINKFLFLVGSFFAPLVPMLFIVGLAILLDTIMGRWAAGHKAKKEGKAYRDVVLSKITRQGVVSKSVSYCLAVSSLYSLDFFIINEVTESYISWPFILTKVVVIFLVWMEYDSIDEKYYNVKGVRLKDKFQEFMRSVKRFISSLFSFKDLFDDKK